MLQQSYLLLQLLWETRNAILWHHVLFLIGCDCFSFVIIKLLACCLSNYFCWVVKEDTSWEIWQQIAQTIFWRIINPFSYPNLSALIDSCCRLAWCLWSLHLNIMIRFNWLGTTYCLSRGCCFRWHLYIFWRGRSYWNRRHHLLLLLNSSLILNLRHFVFHIVLSSLSVINTTSICKVCGRRLPRSSWSWTTWYSTSSTTHWISRSWSFESPWKSTCWLVSSGSLTHKLTNILARRRTG